MDENNISIEYPQTNSSIQKHNYWKLAFFIILFMLVISNWLLFYLFKIKNENIAEDQPKNSPVITSIAPQPQTTSVSNHTPNLLPLELLSLTNGEKLSFNKIYKVIWKNQDLERWGNEIIVCLIGFDSSGKEIAAKREWNEQLCTYRSGDLSGSYLVVKARLSNGSYDWTIPDDLLNRYISQPTKFKIRILVFDNLPAEGRTEWAGNLGWDESKEYLLVGNNL